MEDQVLEQSGVEIVPAAEGQTEAVQTGETTTAAESQPQNNFEKAFAKRLADAQSKWEQEQAEKFKGYEDYKYLADYLQEANGMDVMTLKEQIELERLQARAEKEQVPPSVLKRIDELEAKAAKADEYEQQQAEVQTRTQFETTLKTFCEGKEIGGTPLDHSQLWQYMYENQTNSPEVAYKAMRADYLEQQVANAEKEGVKKFLSAKGSIPTVEGKTAAGVLTKEPPKTFKDAQARAAQRLANWGNMEG